MYYEQLAMWFTEAIITKVIVCVTETGTFYVNPGRSRIGKAYEFYKSTIHPKYFSLVSI